MLLLCATQPVLSLPRIPLAKLMEAILEIEWDHGHSGVLLTEEQADKLDSLWNQTV